MRLLPRSGSTPQPAHDLNFHCVCSQSHIIIQ